MIIQTWELPHDALFHLAAPVSVEESLSNPSKYYDEIVGGTTNISGTHKEIEILLLHQLLLFMEILKIYHTKNLEQLILLVHTQDQNV